jgi:hypothetical protein
MLPIACIVRQTFCGTVSPALTETPVRVPRNAPFATVCATARSSPMPEKVKDMTEATMDIH